jgi:farnesyl-diphosphate farnesyltransferase
MSAFSPPLVQQAYLAAAMQKVSRSFALIVPWIEEPLRDTFATAYLLCRVVDNIEDCSHPFEWQKARFAELGQLLTTPALAADLLAEWDKLSWPGLSAGEAELMSSTGGAALWQIYGQLPAHQRETVAYWVLEMVKGMEAVVDPKPDASKVWHDGIRLLASEADYDRYCYYVAGTVGRLGTRLVVDHFGLDDRTAGHLLSASDACGRGLQKTNIVKDFVADLARQVCYLPNAWLQQVRYGPLALDGAPVEWSSAVVGNVMHDLHEAVAYITSLPRQIGGYRMACLLCLLPAYQTLLHAAQHHAQLFTSAHNAKIARGTMVQCVQEASALVNDNDGIVQYSRKLETAVAAAFGRVDG